MEIHKWCINDFGIFMKTENFYMIYRHNWNKAKTNIICLFPDIPYPKQRTGALVSKQTYTMNEMLVTQNKKKSMKINLTQETWLFLQICALI